ncbi:MAG: hypothetical protein RLZZ383_154, partial [Pseudomonadota bacterium]
GLAEQAPLVALGGAPLPAATTSGRVVLVVNVASYCGYAGQLGDLELLYNRYRARGLVVLGVPCNQFGQEPGSASEIQNFCSTRYGVTFPLLTKQDVNGPLRSGLYRYLVDSAAGGRADVRWNFEKFLVGRDGRVVARFTSATSPLDPVVTTAIEVALGR